MVLSRLPARLAGRGARGRQTPAARALLGQPARPGPFLGPMGSAQGACCARHAPCLSPGLAVPPPLPAAAHCVVIQPEGLLSAENFLLENRGVNYTASGVIVHPSEGAGAGRRRKRDLWQGWGRNTAGQGRAWTAASLTLGWRSLPQACTCACTVRSGAPRA